MFALRNQLLRQSGLSFADAGAQTGRLLVSGSVPVQHRMPRPVPLPKNQQPRIALQPWASYFEPDRNLLAGPLPADEAFFAECGGNPARRLRMTLKQPLPGTVTADWTGDLSFDVIFEQAGGSSGGNAAEWMALELIDGEKVFAYQQSGNDASGNDANEYRFTLSEGLQTALRECLASKVAGDLLLVQARVGHAEQTDGFYQTLSFSLQMAGEVRSRLPLQPYFIHFEDPEYNRQLASAAAIATTNVTLESEVGDEIETVLHSVTLAADRREYNPDSRLALRFDWDEASIATGGTLQCDRIGSNGIPQPLTLSDAALRPRQLKQFSLLDLKESNNQPVRFDPGDTLQLTLKIEPWKAGNLSLPEQAEIVLSVTLVETPVIPKPEAAYGLLRAQTVRQQGQVECVRFAWGPEASRIELVCPEDLRTEVVRRRAVFRWHDAVRPGTLRGYAVQKITQTGSTHFPRQFIDSSD